MIQNCRNASNIFFNCTYEKFLVYMHFLDQFKFNCCKDRKLQFKMRKLEQKTQRTDRFLVLKVDFNFKIFQWNELTIDPG